MRVVYAIRHQSAGVLLDKLYVERPSAEEIERVRLAHSVSGREYWARVVELPIEAPEHVAGHLAEAPHAPPPDLVAEPRVMPKLVMKASATVKSPR
jgi:hypothetical protein